MPWKEGKGRGCHLGVWPGARQQGCSGRWVRSEVGIRNPEDKWLPAHPAPWKPRPCDCRWSGAARSVLTGSGASWTPACPLLWTGCPPLQTPAEPQNCPIFPFLNGPNHIISPQSRSLLLSNAVGDKSSPSMWVRLSGHIHPPFTDFCSFQ